MLIAGKDVKLVLDLGAMKRFKEVTGKNFFSLGTDIDPELLGALIMISAERGGNKVSEEDVDALTVKELTALQEELLGGAGVEGNPQKVSRQK